MSKSLPFLLAQLRQKFDAVKSCEMVLWSLQLLSAATRLSHEIEAQRQAANRELIPAVGGVRGLDGEQLQAHQAEPVAPRQLGDSWTIRVAGVAGGAAAVDDAHTADIDEDDDVLLASQPTITGARIIDRVRRTETKRMHKTETLGTR